MASTGSRLPGTVIKVPGNGPGLLFVAGAQKPFALEGIWNSPQAPAANQVVEVELDELGKVAAVAVVDVQQLAREALQVHGKQAARAASKGVALLLRHKAKVAIGVVALIAVAWFLGRSDLSKGTLAKAINQSLEKNQKPVCWALQNNDVKFPFQVSQWNEPHTDPILGGLIRGGFITAQRARAGMAGGGTYSIDLTPKGRSAGVWSRDGFCVGRSRVDEVQRWTEPVGGAVQVSFTWKIDRPDWADEANFASIPGMQKPVEAIAVVQKTSDGWQVAGTF